MVLHYIKLSFRLLARTPYFTFINIVGLSVGIAVFIVLWQYSSEELKSDQQRKGWGKIVRLACTWEWSDDGNNWESERYGVMGAHIATKIKSDFPEVENMTRLLGQSKFGDNAEGLSRKILVDYQKPDKSHITLRENTLAMVDANYFTFFTIPFISGDPTTAMTLSRSVAMSKSAAQRYFGQTDPLGKMITINSIPHTVTGIFDDFSSNTHMDFDIAISNADYLNNWESDFGPPKYHCYFKLKPFAKASTFESKINDPAVIDRYFGEALKFFSKVRIGLVIQPLSEVSFSQKWRGDTFSPKSKSLLYIFKTIALVVLLLALVNYISLNASRISQRQTEIATRKVSGGSLGDFALQFVTESLVVFTIAIFSALTLIQLAKNPLQNWLSITAPEATSSSILMTSIILLFSVSVTASYPVYLAIVRMPQALLKKRWNGFTGNRGLTALTSMQFIAAVVLIIWGFMIYKQVDFLLTRDLGFSKDDVVVIDAPVLKTKSFQADLDVFKVRVGNVKGVIDATVSNSVMGDDFQGLGVRRPGPNIFVGLDTNGGVDEAFLPFYQIPLIAGRNFLSSDRGNEIIISEGALPRLGFQNANDALESSIEVNVPKENGVAWVTVKIIGVMKGYRLRPMLKFSSDHDIKGDAGLALTYKSHLVSYLVPEKLALRISPERLDESLAEAEQIFKEIFPGNVFQWYFLDENVGRHYQNEMIHRNQVLIFTGIAIGIACLGLLGSISNKVVAKTKEIGIRKVLGATVQNITQVLLSSTVRQIVVASILGIPLAYYLTQLYLESFSERINLVWWNFVVPVAILISIMMGVVATVVWKAAHRQPVEALKTD